MRYLPSFDIKDDPGKLRHYYYANVMPFGDLSCMLSRGGSNNTLSRREISTRVVGPNGEGDDPSYRRWKRVITPRMLEELGRNDRTVVLDIGPVFKDPVCSMRRGQENKSPLTGRELTFDIDLSDYDRNPKHPRLVAKRLCCTGTNVCTRCWKLLIVAVQWVEHVVTRCLGFRDYLVVFSGRRGAHVWVFDRRALGYSEEQRAAVLALFSSEDVKQWAFSNILSSRWVRRTMIEQGMLEGREKMFLLAFLHPDLASRVDATWRRFPGRSADEAYSDLMDVFSWNNTRPHAVQAAAPECWQSFRDMALGIFSPRLDAKVTTGLGHLLKAPFCVHPRTQNICLPMSVDMMKLFDPSHPITLRAACDDPTILQPYLVYFGKFVNSLRRTCIEEARKQEREDREAMAEG